MAATIIDGKRIAEEIKAELKRKVDAYRAKGIVPGLAAVLVGENPASKIYVNMKAKACQKLGIHSEVIQFSENTSQSELISKIEELNNRDDVHGILVQSPLPEGLNEFEVNLRINPQKDVDGFHPENVGRMLIGKPSFLPATPLGIIELLNRSGNSPEGKHVVILGRGNIVGRPLAVMLGQKQRGANATVTLCHTGTKDLTSFTRVADILVAAMGVAEMIKGDMIKPGAVVVDVGTNRVADPGSERGYRLTGDVDFDSVSPIAGAVTPVPGGVGPMTIAMLLSNTVKAVEMRIG
jgi:methylenetetrahydrofolate dehydrogenase (NADP+)/methenyltetrahydrofolate cyclohydrolase